MQPITFPIGTNAGWLLYYDSVGLAILKVLGPIIHLKEYRSEAYQAEDSAILLLDRLLKGQPQCRKP